MEKRPNILLIVVDCLRFDHVGLKVNGKSITPNIDKIAKQGTIFTNAFAQGCYTGVSMPSLLTGMYPSHIEFIKPTTTFFSSVLRWLQTSLYGIEFTMPNFFVGLLPNSASLPKLLKRRDYHTQGFNTNPLLASTFGYQEGFDTFYEDIVTKNSRSLLSQLGSWPRRILDIFNLKLLLPWTYVYTSTEEINRHIQIAIPQINPPYFLWVHYMDTHVPYHPKDVYKKLRLGWLTVKGWYFYSLLSKNNIDELKDVYKTMVSAVDEAIGELLYSLENANLLDDTVIVIASDHGEEFLEHGVWGHIHEGYDALIHVPLIIKVPSAMGPMRPAVNELVELVDVTPTLLSLANIKPTHTLDGISLLGLMKGDCKKHRDYIVSGIVLDNTGYLCARDLNWKLLFNKRRNRKEFYNLQNDPQEKNNLISKIDNKTLTYYENIMSSCSSGENISIKALTEGENADIIRRMKELGYID